MVALTGGDSNVVKVRGLAGGIRKVVVPFPAEDYGPLFYQDLETDESAAVEELE